MQDLINLILAFLEGFALIISPCILPILPIILSGSIYSSKMKPVGIVIGFIICFSIFTFFSRKLIQLFGIDVNIIRNFSLILLVMLGVIMMSDYLSEKFTTITQRFLNTGISEKNFSRFEFINGLAFGALVGFVWTPCAGPILAAVILQTVLQTSDLASFLIIISFGFGIGLPILIFALLGNELINKLSFFKARGKLIRKSLGLIIILSVIYIIYGTFPASEESVNLKDIKQNRLINGLSRPYEALEISGISNWFNSKPLSIKHLKGNVILVDFWTYSCINCIRTFPYLKSWHEKYKDNNFILIAIHSPEFAFEKNPVNVMKAINKYNITYPVALDNDFNTWKNYKNRYWPASYLIDKNGTVVYEHFGEGNYAITENNIRYLLGLNTPVNLNMNENGTKYKITAETYLGYKRSSTFLNETFYKNKSFYYTFPKTIINNHWALQGFWAIYEDYIEAKHNKAKIKLSFNAKNVYAVVGTNKAGSKIIVLLNNTKVKEILVNKYDLYELISLQTVSNGLLEIICDDGIKIYTFTFG